MASETPEKNREARVYEFSKEMKRENFSNIEEFNKGAVFIVSSDASKLGENDARNFSEALAKLVPDRISNADTKRKAIMGWVDKANIDLNMRPTDAVQIKQNVLLLTKTVNGHMEHYAVPLFDTKNKNLANSVKEVIKPLGEYKFVDEKFKVREFAHQAIREAKEAADRGGDLFKLRKILNPKANFKKPEAFKEANKKSWEELVTLATFNFQKFSKFQIYIKNKPETALGKKKVNIEYFKKLKETPLEGSFKGTGGQYWMIGQFEYWKWMTEQGKNPDEVPVEPEPREEPEDEEGGAVPDVAKNEGLDDLMNELEADRKKREAEGKATPDIGSGREGKVERREKTPMDKEIAEMEEEIGNMYKMVVELEKKYPEVVIAVKAQREKDLINVLKQPAEVLRVGKKGIEKILLTSRPDYMIFSVKLNKPIEHAFNVPDKNGLKRTVQIKTDRVYFQIDLIGRSIITEEGESPVRENTSPIAQAQFYLSRIDAYQKGETGTIPAGVYVDIPDRFKDRFQ